MSTKASILEQYEEQRSLYDDFRKKIEILLKELLIQNKIHYHQITSRLKDKSKVAEKADRKNNKYSDLGEITDIAGVRIITYFEDEVDKIEDFILGEFEIDIENSIDKRKLEADRFGYRSLHFIISLNSKRDKLIEYKRFKGLKLELQIRSILQHAWAEIEHDIGYKGEVLIPNSLKRNFYRVAALLESSDIEFVNIKNKLSDYKLEVEKKLARSTEELPIDKISYSSFLEKDEDVFRIDNLIAKNSNLKYINEIRDIDKIQLERFKFLGVENIKDLKDLLLLKEQKLLEIAFVWLGFKDYEASVNKGISIFYLCYVLAGEKGKETLRIYFNDYIYQNRDKDKISKDVEDGTLKLMNALKQSK